MSLDVVDTIKSTFGSLKTDAGMKVLGLLFVIQLVNMGSSFLVEMGTAAAVLSGLIALGAGVAMVFITVGAFRSFDSGKVESDQYTSNILWPVVRITGANLVTTIFAYGLAFVALLPAIIAGGLTGIGMSSVGAGMAAGSTLIMGLVGIVGALLGLVAFFYVFLTLTVSVPIIAVEDSRLFEALDRSVQRTKGNKISMFLAALPVGLLYLVGMIIVVAGSESMTGAPTTQTTSPVIALLTSVITAVTGTLFFSLLNEYHQRLPE